MVSIWKVKPSRPPALLSLYNRNFKAAVRIVVASQTGPPLYLVLCPDWTKWAGIPEDVLSSAAFHARVTVVTDRMNFVFVCSVSCQCVQTALREN